MLFALTTLCVRFSVLAWTCRVHHRLCWFDLKLSTVHAALHFARARMNNGTHAASRVRHSTSNSDNGLDKWFIMGAIGASVGALCGLMKCFEELFMEKRLEFVEQIYHGPETSLGLLWAWVTLVALAMAAVSSLLVVYIAPEAAAGGIPEVIGCVQSPSLLHACTL